MIKGIVVTALLLESFKVGQTCWSRSVDVPPEERIKIREKYLHFYNKLPWKNGDEASWPGKLCKKGAGTRQSPIDILVHNATVDVEKHFIKYGPLIFRGYDDRQIPMLAFNNGHTLQFISKGTHGYHPTVQGGPLQKEYRLEQVHFHWPSEHAFNGQKFSMEVHFVHVRVDLNAEFALEEWDGVAILAVFWHVQIMSENRPVMAPSEFRHFSKLAVPGSRLDVYMDVGDLLSPNRKTYFTYAGSLSSPECNEAVIWILFEEPLVVPESHYRMFSFIGVQSNNFRSLQPFNQHKVYRTAYHSFFTPIIQDTFTDFVRVFGTRKVTIFRNIFKLPERIVKAADYAINKFNPDLKSIKLLMTRKGSKNSQKQQEGHKDGVDDYKATLGVPESQPSEEESESEAPETQTGDEAQETNWKPPEVQPGKVETKPEAPERQPDKDERSELEPPEPQRRGEAHESKPEVTEPKARQNSDEPPNQEFIKKSKKKVRIDAARIAEWEHTNLVLSANNKYFAETF